MINYDFLRTLEDYVHSIGRTGHAGAKGLTFTFFTPSSTRYACELVKILCESRQDVTHALLFMIHSTLGIRIYRPFQVERIMIRERDFKVN